MDYITTAQAAETSGFSDSTLRRAIDRGDLPAVKLGKTWLIKPGDFERWVNTPAMHKRGKK